MCIIYAIIIMYLQLIKYAHTINKLCIELTYYIPIVNKLSPYN